jgi:acyl carrier protein
VESARIDADRTDATSESPDRPRVAASIRSFLQAQSPEKVIPLGETADLVKEWFVDSMTIVSVVAFLEAEFGVQVKRADINGKTFRSLQTLTDYVVARMASKR